MRHLRRITIVSVLALTHAACADADADAPTVGECFSNDECSSGACFLGVCVDPGFGLGSVDIDVQPPQSNGPLPQRLSRLFEASSGPQDLTLLQTLHVTGVVSRNGVALDGSLRAFSTSSGICVATENDDVFTYDGSVKGGVVALDLVPGSYRVVFTPADPSLPPFALPSDGSCGVNLAAGSTLDIAYPEPIVVSGRLRYSVSDSTGVAGAHIVVTATNAVDAHFETAPMETTSDGSFSLLIPPTGTTYDVRVKPGTNTNVPTAVFANVTRDVAGSVGDLTLGVSAPVGVVVTVTDTSGVPVAETTILVAGDLGVGTYSTTAAVMSSGSVTIALRAGTYTVIAIPRRSLAVGLASAQLVVADGEAPAPRLNLILTPKLAISGIVYSSDGAPMGNARVTYNLRDIAVERSITTTTTSTGAYEVLLDTQSPNVNESSAEYEIIVEPASGSRAPRHRELTRVDSSTTTHDITLFAANYIYGTLRTNDGEPLPNASMLFYSRVGREKPILLGIAQTTTVGEFTVPLPQP